MLVGYTLVSTAEQSLALQQDALAAAGCGRIFTDVASGAAAECDGLAAALDYLYAEAAVQHRTILELQVQGGLHARQGQAVTSSGWPAEQAYPSAFPSLSYTVTGPNASASSGPRTAAGSPTTTSCSSSGCRCWRAARSTSAASTARTFAR